MILEQFYLYINCVYQFDMFHISGIN